MNALSKSPAPGPAPRQSDWGRRALAPKGPTKHMALTPAERAHWDVFGFLVLRSLYTPEAMTTLTAEAQRLIEADAGARMRRVDGVEYDMEDLPPSEHHGDKFDRVRWRERVTLDSASHPPAEPSSPSAPPTTHTHHTHTHTHTPPAKDSTRARSTQHAHNPR